MSGRLRAGRWALPVCLLLTALAFAPALGFGFVYDDSLQILENRYIKSWYGLVKAFTDHVWAFAPDAVGARYYRPLFLSALTVNYQAFGPHAAGYHAVSILLHLGCAALLWRFLSRLGVTLAQRACAVLIFSLHPLQIQAVAWPSAVSDPMAVLLSLACMLSWARWLSQRDARALGLALVSFAAALLTLERALALAGPLLLLGFFRRELLEASTTHAASLAQRLRASALQAGLLALPVVAVFALRRAVIGSGSPPPERWLVESLLTAPDALVFYASKLAWPRELSIASPVYFVSAPSPKLLGPVAIVLVLGAVAYFLSRGRPRRVFFLLSGLCLLSPALCIGLLPGHALVQDRYMYFPLAFFAAWLAELAFGDESQPSRGLVLGRAVLGLWLLTSLAFHSRNLEVWQDDLTLFGRGFEVVPESPMTAMHLAVAAGKRELIDPECRVMRQAVDMQQRYPRRGNPSEIHFTLGNCLREQGERADALVAYADAQRASGGKMLRAEVNQVLLLGELGRSDEAKAMSRAVVQRHPGESSAWTALGVAATYRNDLEPAERAIEKALELDPSDERTRELLERIRAAQKR